MFYFLHWLLINFVNTTLIFMCLFKIGFNLGQVQIKANSKSTQIQKVQFKINKLKFEFD